MNAAPSAVSRRGFLKTSVTAAGGLMLAWHPLPAVFAANSEQSGPAALGYFVRIEPDGTTVIGARGCEIGQGVKTSLPMLIAEELDADWSKVRVEQMPYGLVPSNEAPGVAAKYGPQGAGGSTSVSDGWADLRQAGARARAMLVRAAAERWQTDAATLTTENGHVLHPDGRSSELRCGRRRLQRCSPRRRQTSALKKPADYRIIGRPTRTVDAEEIVTGRARYGLDATLPGALVAVVERCPYFSGGLASYDASAARAVPGVRDVVVLPGPAPGDALSANLATGVAVIADDTWAALKGRRALKVEWTHGPYAEESSASLDAQCTKLLAGQGRRVREDGDFDRARAAAARVVEARYRVPYVSHCPLEPQNACAHVQADKVTILAPLQSPGGASRVAHQLTGIDRLKIDITMTRVGGGFGRRLEQRFRRRGGAAVEADGQADQGRMDARRRPAPRLLPAVRPPPHDRDARPEGTVTGWAHRLASASKHHRRPEIKPDEMWMPEIYTDDFPARCVPNLRYEWFAVDSGVARGSWRAPAHTANAFVVESFIDEIAHASEQDPLALRLALLGPARELPYEQHGGPTFNPGRLVAVLKHAATAIGWGRPVVRGRGLGLASHFTFGGYAAHAMEVSVDGEGGYRIERCVCAVDVGRAINPLGLEAQMMGGTIDGISTARNLEITIEGGRVRESNFDGYPLLAHAGCAGCRGDHRAERARSGWCRRDGDPDRGARARERTLRGDRQAHPVIANQKPPGLRPRGGK